MQNVSKGSGLDFSGYCMGVAVGNVNNDGRPDVLVTEDGGVRLFLNQGNGKFIDVTKAAGVDNPAWATSATFVDFDRDGWLDLVVVNYLDYVPTRRCSGTDGLRDYCAARLCRPGHQAIPQPWPTRRRVERGPFRGRDADSRARQCSRAGPGRAVRRLQRRRLARHPDRQRRQTEPPMDQPARRHLQGRSGAARPRLQQHGPGRVQHGYRPGRR